MSSQLKKKKKSNTAVINDLRKRLRQTIDENDRLWLRIEQMEERIDKIKSQFPNKYFMIKYSIKTSSGSLKEYEEIFSGLTADDSIFCMKKDLRTMSVNNERFNLETFELLKIKLMA